MSLRRYLSYGLTALLAIAGVAMLVSAEIGDDIIYRLSLAVASMSGTGLMVLRTRVGEAALERARQRGYDDGYADRCTVERRSELRLVGSAGAHGGLLDGAAQQFGRQGNIGSGA